jgi:UDP-N-acetylmuramate--alanine ligase
MVSVVTNIEADHMETYDFDFERLKDTYLQFLHNLPFYGLAVLCIDDETIESILIKIGRPTLTYGFNQKAAYRIKNFASSANTCCFQVDRPDDLPTLQVKLNIPGVHNALNATAAIAVASDEGISDQSIVRGLESFSGVGRRFEIIGEFPVAQGTAMLVDDYGHHPTEIRATIDAVRAGWPSKRLVMAFQPHRYSRTRDMFDEFVDVLSQVDQLILTDVYSAGEEVIDGATSEDLSLAIEQRGAVKPVYVGELQRVTGAITDLVQADDLVLTQGAGSVTKLVAMLTESELGQVDT